MRDNSPHPQVGSDRVPIAAGCRWHCLPTKKLCNVLGVFVQALALAVHLPNPAFTLPTPCRVMRMNIPICSSLLSFGFLTTHRLSRKRSKSWRPLGSPQMLQETPERTLPRSNRVLPSRKPASDLCNSVWGIGVLVFFWGLKLFLAWQGAFSVSCPRKHLGA